MTDLYEPELLRVFKLSPKLVQWFYFVALGVSIVIGLFILVPEIWIPTLQEGGVIHTVLTPVVGLIGFVTHVGVYMFMGGLFLGSASLWLADTFKLIHAIILWGCIIVALLLFARSWNQSLEGFQVGLVLLTIAWVGVLQLSGLPLIQRYTDLWGPDKKRLLSRPPRKFRGAVTFTFLFLTVFTLIGLIDVLQGFRLTQQEGIYIIASGLVVGPVYIFQKYADEENIIQLGPSRSGKTSIQGGLYKSVNRPIEKESLLLDEIVEEYMDYGQFPERTDINSLAGDRIDGYTLNVTRGEEPSEEDEKRSPKNSYIIEFTYVSRRDLLFPKKRRITAIDYPGELLTGLGDKDPLSKYIDGLEERDGWEEILEKWHESSNDLDPDEFMTDLSKLVQRSDWIMFTLPLDDFIQNLVHDRPEQIPDYHKKALAKIESVEENGEKKFVEKPLDSQDEGDEVREDELWLGNDRKYSRNKNARAHPTDYLQEYTRIIEALDDTKNHHFMWIASMADLVYDDFMNHLDSISMVQETEYGPNIKIDGETVKINTNSDIDVSMVKDLFSGGDPESSVGHYLLFSRWIQEECIAEYGPNFKTAMAETFEKHLFPVWFDISDPDEKKFEVNSRPVLKGSQYIRSRLNGKRLKDEYPSGIIRYKYFGGNKVIPKSLMGYEILETVKKNIGEDENQEEKRPPRLR